MGRKLAITKKTPLFFCLPFSPKNKKCRAPFLDYVIVREIHFEIETSVSVFISFFCNSVVVDSDLSNLVGKS